MKTPKRERAPARPFRRDRGGGRLYSVYHTPSQRSPLAGEGGHTRFAVMKMLVAAAALFAAPAFAQSSAPIDPARMSAIVKELASDAYQGRAPGTPGEDKTIAYLVAQVKGLGLEPAGDKGGWAQAVPLVHTKIAPVKI